MTRPITDRCPRCGNTIVLALWLSDGEFVHVDPDEAGNLAGSEDGNGFAWVRPVKPGGQLELGERLYRLHELTCPALVADFARYLQRRRNARSVPDRGGSRAHAR